MSNPNFDFNSLVAPLKDTVLTALRGLVTGAAKDVEQYAGAVATELSVAISEGDTKLVAELEGQLKTLAEINRIRFVRGKWETFTSLTNVAVKAASAGLSVGLGALGVV